MYVCQDYQQHYGVCKHSLATILELRDKNETAKKRTTKKIIDKMKQSIEVSDK